MRLVEAEGQKIGVFRCAGGDPLAIEDRCSHDDGPLAEGEFDARLHSGMPPPRLAVRRSQRPAEDAPGIPAGRDLRRPRRDGEIKLEVD